MRKLILLCICSLLVLTSVFHTVNAQSFDADDVTGIWLTADKTGEITIYKDAGKYFGKITGGNSDQEFDIHNPDKERRSDPLLGLVIIKDLEYKKKDMRWEDGTVYDPQNGKRYSCNLKLLDGNTLRITGYIGFSWIGRSEEWTRIE